MSHDPQVIETILYFKAIFDLQHPDEDHHRLDKAWKQLWKSVCIKAEADTLREHHTTLVDYTISLLRRDRERYLSVLNNPNAHKHVIDTELYWEIHCDQMYAITTDLWTQTQFWKELDRQKEIHDRWRKSFRWREIALEESLQNPQVWAFGEVLANAEYNENTVRKSREPAVKEEEMVKHLSVEIRSSEERVLIPPRDSIEPHHHGDLRATDELHHLSSMRLTDEIVESAPLRSPKELSYGLDVRQPCHVLLMKNTSLQENTSSPAIKVDPLEDLPLPSACATLRSASLRSNNHQPVHRFQAPSVAFLRNGHPKYSGLRSYEDQDESSALLTLAEAAEFLSGQHALVT